MAGKIKVDQIETVAGSGTITLNNDVAMAATKTLPAASLTGTLPAISGASLTGLNATNLGSGTIPDARFPSTLPAASAANLTAVPAANITGTLPAISGANLTGIGGGLLQVKQYRKLSTIDQNGNTEAVLAAPFNGSATITAAATSNFIRATFMVAVDHGTTWRSGWYTIQYSTDGTNYKGLAGGGESSFNSSANMVGQTVTLTGMFQAATTSANTILVRCTTEGHASGDHRQHGQYTNEGNDTSSVSPKSYNSEVAVGMVLILEEIDGSICTTANTA